MGKALVVRVLSILVAVLVVGAISNASPLLWSGLLAASGLLALTVGWRHADRKRSTPRRLAHYSEPVPAYFGTRD